MKIATTPTDKFILGECKKCSHYWQRNDYETCTNDEMHDLYGKKNKIGSMQVCVFYDPCE